MVQHLTIARVAEALAVSWNTANTAVLAEGRRVLIDDPHRFNGVTAIGVDEHTWRHTRHGDKYVTVIIDLTPTRTRTGPSRLLDMIEGRSKQAFSDWLAQRDQAWRDRVEIVAMDGFTGFKTATSDKLPAAVAVMDPFHVVKLAGDALDDCRRRIQQTIHGRRDRAGDPLYATRRVLHTGNDLLTEKQQARIEALFSKDRHVQVEATWGVYQHLIAAYRNPRPGRRQDRHDQGHRRRQHQAAGRADRAPPTRPNPETPSRRHPRHSTGPAAATDPPRRSMAASNTSAAPPSASATSPTTSPGACSRPAASDTNYTLDCEEPLFFDLVFVYAMSQVTELMLTDVSWLGFGHGALGLLAVWWAWVCFAWLTNAFTKARVASRYLVLGAMAAMLLAASALPTAFGDGALVFGVALLIVRVIHLAVFSVAASHDNDLRSIFHGWPRAC